MGKLRRFLKEERGAASIMVAVSLVALLGMGALAVDLGYVMSTRSEVQKAADASALAAASRLVQLYNDQNGNLNEAEMTAAAIEAANQSSHSNTASNTSLSVASGDVQLGVWNPTNKTFTLGGAADEMNAVKITMRRDGSTNGPISLFFGSVVGVSTVNVSAQAVSWFGSVGSVGEGGVTLPLVISQDAYVQGSDPLTFHADGEDTSGWSTFFETGGGSSLVAAYITGETPIPAVKVGDQLNVYNGNMSNNLFQYMQGKVQENNGEWTVVIPIVEGDKFNQTMKVVGFATMVITAVNTAPEKTINGYFVNAVINKGKPGGSNFGSYARSVVLVR
jgi:Flp pilus assembly protein TadG